MKKKKHEKFKFIFDLKPFERHTSLILTFFSLLDQYVDQCFSNAFVSVGIYLIVEYRRETSILSRYIDEHQKDYVQRLSDAVAIPSVSAWPEHRPEVVRMVHWTKAVGNA